MAKKESNILLIIKVKSTGKGKKHPNKKESVKKYKGQGR